MVMSTAAVTAAMIVPNPFERLRYTLCLIRKQPRKFYETKSPEKLNLLI
jgi:hypothetical protein